MIGDIVVDTNVLAHANNSGVSFQSDSIDFIESLLHGTTLEICVDEGFDILLSSNRSIIGHEYHTHLSFGMLGFSFLQQMAQSNRIKVVSKKVGAREGKILNQNIANKHDVVFVKITINSDSKILISHDYDDFPERIRLLLKKEVSIKIISANQY